MNATSKDSFFKNWGVIIPLTIICALLVAMGPLEAPDTHGYIHFSHLRQPLSCYFFDFFQTIFGQHFYWPVFITQLLLGIVASWHMTRTFERVFVTEKLTTIFIFFILLSPYYLPTRFANYILSEGLAYPLFIAAISFFAQSLWTRNFKYYLRFLGFTLLLVLTRRQFIFLYPFIIAFVIYQCWRKPVDVNPFPIIAASLLAIGLAECLDLLYYYYHWGAWTHAPFTWRQASVALLYLSQPSDINLFTDPFMVKIFTETRQMMMDQRMGFDPATLGQWPRDFIYYQHYYLHYNDICHRILGTVLGNNGLISDIDREVTLKQITVILFKKYYADFLILYIFNIVKNLGSYFYILQIALVGLWSMLAMLKPSVSPRIQLTFWICLLNAGNYMAIALVEPAMKRYTLYTDSIQLAVLMVFIFAGFRALMVPQTVKR